jgi:hypothetical protein
MKRASNAAPVDDFAARERREHMCAMRLRRVKAILEVIDEDVRVASLEGLPLTNWQLRFLADDVARHGLPLPLRSLGTELYTPDDRSESRPVEAALPKSARKHGASVAWQLVSGSAKRSGPDFEGIE